MEKPQFRRWFGFSYIPTNLAGWLVATAFLLGELAIGALALSIEAGSPAWWLSGAAMFAGFVFFWAFVDRHSAAR